MPAVNTAGTSVPAVSRNGEPFGSMRGACRAAAVSGAFTAGSGPCPRAEALPEGSRGRASAADRRAGRLLASVQARSRRAERCRNQLRVERALERLLLRLRRRAPLTVCPRFGDRPRRGGRMLGQQLLEPGRQQRRSGQLLGPLRGGALGSNPGFPLRGPLDALCQVLDRRRDRDGTPIAGRAAGLRADQVAHEPEDGHWRPGGQGAEDAVPSAVD